jgi:hypothetical protein
MLSESIATLEATIREHDRLTPQQKAELFAQLAALKADIAALATTPAGHAHRRARVTDVSAQEATRPQQPPDQLRLAMAELGISVEAFEASNPELVHAVNKISAMLASIGI